MVSADKPRIYWVSCLFWHGQRTWTQPKGKDSLAKEKEVEHERDTFNRQN